MKQEMKKAKFVFCIREDIAGNHVATPTKLSSYVCNGVFPVYSSCMKAFHKLASGYRRTAFVKMIRICWTGWMR